MPPSPVLLLTRPQAQSDRFAQAARDKLGPMRVIVSPLMKIHFLDAPLPEGARVFTSQNGVQAHLRLAPAAGRTAWCVGAQTAQAARTAGFAARETEGDARALVALIVQDGATGPLVHVRGVHARGDVADRLNAAGIETSEVVLYDQIPCPLVDEAKVALSGSAPVFVPLFSPRSAQLFADAAAGARAPLHLVALSPAVAQALNNCPRASLDIAARPEAGAMLTALADRIAASTRA